MNPIFWRRVCGGLWRHMRGLRRRVCENRGFTATQMVTAVLLTLISATVAIDFMIFALNRAETENWTSRAQILCADASRSVQNWLSRASGVEPGLPSDGSVKEAELVCFLAAEPDGVPLWRAFRGGTLESWTRDAENGEASYTPLVADASDLSYRFDPDTGAYDFGPDGRAAISVQVFCAEESHTQGAAAEDAATQAAAEDAATQAAAEDAATEGADAKKPRMEDGAAEDIAAEEEAMEGAAAEEDAMAEYLFRVAVSVLPVGGGEGVVNTFTIRPMLAPPMRGIQRETAEEAIEEEPEEAIEEAGQAEEPIEETEQAEEPIEETEQAEEPIEE